MQNEYKKVDKKKIVNIIISIFAIIIMSFSWLFVGYVVGKEENNNITSKEEINDNRKINYLQADDTQRVYLFENNDDLNVGGFLYVETLNDYSIIVSYNISYFYIDYSISEQVVNGYGYGYTISTQELYLDSISSKYNERYYQFDVPLDDYTGDFPEYAPISFENIIYNSFSLSFNLMDESDETYYLLHSFNFGLSNDYVYRNNYITSSSTYAYGVVDDPIHIIYQNELVLTFGFNLKELFASDYYFNDGYMEGYDIGFDIGKNQGYEEGIKSSLESNYFKTLFNAILNAPYNIYNGLLNFEIFGVNLFALFSFIFTTALIIFIIQLFKK